jgi:hypothetical protein
MCNSVCPARTGWVRPPRTPAATDSSVTASHVNVVSPGVSQTLDRPAPRIEGRHFPMRAIPPRTIPRLVSTGRGVWGIPSVPPLSGRPCSCSTCTLILAKADKCNSNCDLLKLSAPAYHQPWDSTHCKGASVRYQIIGRHPEWGNE